MSTEKIITKKTNEENIDRNSLGVRVRGQRNRVATLSRGVSLTKQADRDAANIHNILGRYAKTGLLPQRQARPLERAVPTVDSFHEAMNIVVGARQAFEQLPSKIRQKFENNPAKLLEALHDENKHAELIELGVLNAPERSPEEPPAQGAGAGEGGATPPSTEPKTE